jgi:hypothetical protein
MGKQMDKELLLERFVESATGKALSAECARETLTKRQAAAAELARLDAQAEMDVPRLSDAITKRQEELEPLRRALAEAQRRLRTANDALAERRALHWREREACLRVLRASAPPLIFDFLKELL